jgi:Fic family protein
MRVGGWREDAAGPMQVVSGRIDLPTIHFQAPPAARVPAEMEAFLRWFEAPEGEDGLLRSAIAHLWFLTIHPYDDGNGRIGRAIADMALARDAKSSRRYYSMSRQINAEKSAYYAALERAQRGNLDVTNWLTWFLGSYGRAIEAAKAEVGGVLKAQAFWRSHEDAAISDRQRRALNRLMNNFEGKLTVKKWGKLVKASDDTALRDITDLVDKGVLVKNPGGSKNTSYSLVGYEIQPAAEHEEKGGGLHPNGVVFAR